MAHRDLFVSLKTLEYVQQTNVKTSYKPVLLGPELLLWGPKPRIPAIYPGDSRVTRGNVADALQRQSLCFIHMCIYIYIFTYMKI